MANFSVAARTLIHLGAELITSDEVAINELIKNAFDAESPRVKISFHIAIPQAVVQTAINQIRGAVSASQFKVAIAAAKTAIQEEIDVLAAEDKQRDELIEKLSKLDEVKTPVDAQELLEAFNFITIEDTGIGMDANTLESVFLTIGTPFKLSSQKSGSLHRKILGNKGIGRLAMMRLGDRATVTSWTEPKTVHSINFDWRDFEDPSKEISDVKLDVKSAVRPRSSNSGTVITVTALKSPWTEDLVRNRFVAHFVRRLQNPFAKPAHAGQPASFPIDIYVNEGKRIPIDGMLPVLTDHTQADFELIFDPSGIKALGSQVNVLRTELMDYQRGAEPLFTLRSMDEVALKVQGTAEELERIGPFRAFIRWFNRDQLRKTASLQGTWKAAQKELDLWSGGIAIYRDGFRVGFTGQSTGEDWLGLDSSALKRSGFTVNRIQVVGALEISREDNPGLVDRSNREGLIESRDASLIREVLTHFAIEELRRYIDHEGKEEKKEKLDELIESAPATIADRALKAEQGLMEIRAKVSPEVRVTVQSIADHIHFIKGEVKNFEQAAKQALSRREDILELAGVGTVMSGVLHELTRTTGNTRQLLQQLSKGESPKTQALLSKLEAEVKAINTRLRQLDPLSPSGRHRKESFDLTALLNTIVNGYASRFERHQISCQLLVAGASADEHVTVTMVRGFVSLAIENLMTNSVYWLQQGLKSGEAERKIFLELDAGSRTLTFFDNGPGISPADKDRVFTAGFSMRPRGQGLGLFIAAEVARYHDAKLALDSIDDDGRYRGFVLELPQD